MNIVSEGVFKNRKIFFLIFIIGVGIFLRSYHFSDWLNFEIDQTYDIRLVSPAVSNGILNLPLLGPTAGGGRSLRLGPAVYYMEYLSAKIFGNTPTGHATLILVLSFFSLPLFYLVCRRYFSIYLSLGLLAIFSFSSYLVLYSRFSWSPNFLPFFILFLFWTLLKSVSPQEKNKDRWFLVAIFTFAIITQIHFNAFFIVPVVLFIFLLIKRPHFQWKTWILAIVIFTFAYSPMIISDYYTHGENFNFFLKKIGIKSVETAPQSIRASFKLDKLYNKTLENFKYNSLEYFLIISGNDLINTSFFARKTFGLSCNSCQKDFYPRMEGYSMFVLIFLVLIWNLFREKDEEKKNFLILSGLLLAISFLYYLLISYDGYNIYPRFFLLVAPLAIILLGLMFEKLNPDKNKFGLVVFVVIIFILSFFNMQRLKKNFIQLKNTETSETKVETEDIFPNNSRITLTQQIDIMDYIKSKYNQNKYPIYIKSIHEYAPIFWYFLDREKIPFNEITETDIYQEGNYFLILPSYKLSSNEMDKYTNKFDLKETKDFGTLEVFYLISKPEAATAEKENMENKKPTLQSQQISEILTWKKIFSKP